MINPTVFRKTTTDTAEDLTGKDKIWSGDYADPSYKIYRDHWTKRGDLIGEICVIT